MLPALIIATPMHHHKVAQARAAESAARERDGLNESTIITEKDR